VVFNIPYDLVKAVGAKADYFGHEALKGACDIQLRGMEEPESKKMSNSMEYKKISVG
jgi:hypothetical protein